MWAPLLGASWFDLAPYGAINLHYGISSVYRGEHTLFYPLLFGEQDALGVTLHRIDKSIDAGPIYAMGYPSLSGHECEAEIYALCAEMAARMLLGLLGRIEMQDIQPTTLKLKSRLIKYTDRRMIDDFRFVFSRTRLPSRQERIEWLCSNSREWRNK